MATLKEQRRELQRKAEQFQRQARKQLENIVQSGRGNGRMMDPFGATQSATAAGFGLSAPSQNSAATTFRHGQTVTDTDVKRFIESGGGNVYTNALRELDRKAKEQRRDGRSLGRMGSDVTRAANANAQNALQQLAADFQRQQDEANFQNEMRYQQGLGENAYLRQRNQERVKNFGEAAKQDLEERFKQSLGDVSAGLVSRGLGNSTVLSAFEAKNARDKARELQRLSEMVDDRASRYDTADTQNLVGFVERRDDIAPDFNQLAQLAQAYGASGASGMGQEPLDQMAGSWGGGTSAGGGQREEQQAAPLQFGMNLPYATSPWNAGRIANSYQGNYGNPLLAQQNAVNQIAGVPMPTGSNAYPQTRSPEEYAQIQQNMQQTRPLKVRKRTTLPASTRLDQLQYFA